MSVDTLQRFGLKLFLQSGQEVDPKSLIPVFHRWIQTGAVGGLLIDVADYTHLAEGPSVLLVGHEGNYAFDYRDDGPGCTTTGNGRPPGRSPIAWWRSRGLCLRPPICSRSTTRSVQICVSAATSSSW